MAIGDSTLFQQLSGSLGNLVIYKVGNQIRVREKPTQYKDAKSKTQLKQRSKVKTIAQLFQRLDLQLEVYWKQLTVGTTLSGYNLFFKENIKYVDGDGEIEDFHSFKICKGVLPLPEEIKVTFKDAREMIIEWDKTSAPPWGSGDNLQLAAYTPLRKKNPGIRVLEIPQTMRKEGYYKYLIPASLEKPVHLFAFFKAKFTNEVSDSHYLGYIEK